MCFDSVVKVGWGGQEGNADKVNRFVFLTCFCSAKRSTINKMLLVQLVHDGAVLFPDVVSSVSVCHTVTPPPPHLWSDVQTLCSTREIMFD